MCACLCRCMQIEAICMSPLDRDREQRAPPRDISDNFRVNILTPKIRKKNVADDAKAQRDHALVALRQ